MRLQSTPREIACCESGRQTTSRNFGTGTRGFAASEDANTAVCVLPGTELAFSREVACWSYNSSDLVRVGSCTGPRSSGR